MLAETTKQSGVVAEMVSDLVGCSVEAYKRLGRNGNVVLLQRDRNSREAFGKANGGQYSTLVRIAEVVNEYKEQGKRAPELVAVTAAMLDALTQIKYAEAVRKPQQILNYGPVKVKYGPDGFGANIDGDVSPFRALGLLTRAIFTESRMIATAVARPFIVGGRDDEGDYFDPMAGDYFEEAQKAPPYYIPH